MKRFLTFVMLTFGTIAVASAQQVTIRWSDVVPATHPSVQMIEKIAANVKEKSRGLINIQAFPNGQLGSSRDTIDATANGVQFNETLIKSRGMRILGTTYYGTRHITTSNKEVKTPADMVGLKLRVP